MRTLLVLIAAVGAMSSLAYGEEWSKQFTVSGKPELRLQTDDAGIEVHSAPGNTISARVITRGWSIGTHDGVRVDARQSGNIVDISVRVPSMHFSMGNRSVRMEITVPPELRVEARTSDGHIIVRGVKGEAKLTTDDGGVEIEGFDGALNARSSDGRISARGRFDLLDLHTSDGSVSATAEEGSRMAGPWRIETGDGSVTVRLPERFAADLDANTGDGGISVRLPITTNATRREENAVRGKLNGGGLPFRIRTGDGGIRIERL